jgi:hypothetical protein
MVSMKLSVGFLVASIAVAQAWMQNGWSSTNGQSTNGLHIGPPGENGGLPSLNGFQYCCQPPSNVNQLDNNTQAAIASVWSNYNANVSGSNCSQEEEQTHTIMDNYFVAQITTALNNANLTATQTSLANAIIQTFVNFKAAAQADQDAVIMFFMSSIASIVQEIGFGGMSNFGCQGAMPMFGGGPGPVAVPMTSGVQVGGGFHGFGNGPVLVAPMSGGAAVGGAFHSDALGGGAFHQGGLGGEAGSGWGAPGAVASPGVASNPVPVASPVVASHIGAVASPVVASNLHPVVAEAASHHNEGNQNEGHPQNEGHGHK